MGFGLLKIPVYYEQVKKEPTCSCDKFCDVNELELMRQINNFTCTYFNLKKDNMDLIKESKSKVEEILEYLQENIINNKPAPVCCGDYCNKEELEFFKVVNNHYNEYFNLTKEEKEKIIEGSEKLKEIFDILKNTFNLNPCSLTSLSLIQNAIRRENIEDIEYENRFNTSMSLNVKPIGFSFGKNQKHKNNNTNNNNFDCD
tara:strand:- start:896 stop:1498 length:603 start_codon:yes stop_codon:yes gene_type:complete